MPIPAKDDPQTIAMDNDARALALQVVDDVVQQAQADDGFKPRPEPRGEDGSQRQAPKPRFDNKRADIISRFRTIRDERPADPDNEIDNFTRSGVPQEFEQYRVDDEGRPAAPAPEPAAQQVDPEPEAPAQKRKIRLKVNHQIIEMDEDDVIAYAQRAVASDNILDNAKSKAREIDELLAQTRNRVARSDPNDGHHAVDQRSQQVDQGQDQNGAAHTSDGDDEYTRLVETIQVGAPEDAVALLKDTIHKAATSVVTTRMQQDRMQDETARTGKVLTDFNTDHPELQEDEYAQAVMKQHVFKQQVEDLVKLGVTMDSLAQSVGHNPTPGDIAMAHQYYRAHGYKLTDPATMLTKAHDKLTEWRGGPKPNPKLAQGEVPPKAPPRIAVNVDRSDRRQQIQPAPNRNSAPQPQQRQATPQRRDLGAVVQRVQQHRGLPRGRPMVNGAHQ